MYYVIAKSTLYSCVLRYIFKDSKRVGMQELGPRFTLKLRSVQKGTFDSKYGEYMWLHEVTELEHMLTLPPTCTHSGVLVHTLIIIGALRSSSLLSFYFCCRKKTKNQNTSFIYSLH